MKKKTANILAKIRTLILSDSFKKRHKKSKECFIRNRIFSFLTTFSLTLNLLRRTIQMELYSFFDIDDILSDDKKVYTNKQAFCAARQKISYTAYVEINKVLLDEFYKDNKINLFLDFRLLIVDGSTLLLPESPEIRNYFGACSNGKKKELIPTARISHIYDPLNKIILDAIIDPYKGSERAMAIHHIKNIDQHFKNLILFDRGYPSTTLFFAAKENNSEVVMRSPLTFLPTFAQEKIKNGGIDFQIELSARKLKGNKRKEFKKQLPGLPITSVIKVRVLVIELETGEKEILITTLLDVEQYPYKIFKTLYNMRWGIEEGYKFIKIPIEIENFSTKTVNGIKQEFNGTIFISNVRALLADEAQTEIGEALTEKNKIQEKEGGVINKNKYEYIINRNISIGLIKNNLVFVLLDKNVDIQKFCEKIKNLMKRNLVPIRKNRKVPRTRIARRRYHITIRRSL